MVKGKPMPEPEPASTAGSWDRFSLEGAKALLAGLAGVTIAEPLSAIFNPPSRPAYLDLFKDETCRCRDGPFSQALVGIHGG
jgi:hypothetical protein